MKNYSNIATSVVRSAVLVSTLVLVASCSGMSANEIAANLNQENSSEVAPGAPSEDVGGGGGHGGGGGPGSGPSFNLRSQVKHFRALYKLNDPYTKLVDNRGKGYADLDGVRNLRVVLHGVYYRGGANNKYDSEKPRSNSNPLPTKGLNNLCEEGFTESIYLYSTNYSSAPKSVSCSDSGELEYNQITGLSSSNTKKLMTRIYEHIKGVRPGPMYAHCWNGWHASGFVAAAALKQFCKWSSSAAEDYWVKNTDGNSKGYESVRKRVRDFAPYSDLAITDAERALICP